MKTLKCLITFLGVLSISACSWFGGKPCDSMNDSTCDSAVSSNTYPLQPKWYCQGDITERTWSCSHDTFADESFAGRSNGITATNSFKLATLPLSAKKPKAVASFSAIASGKSANQGKQDFKPSTSKTGMLQAPSQLAAATTENLPAPSLAMSESQANSAAVEENEIADMSHPVTNESGRSPSGDATYDRFIDLPSDSYAIQLLASKTLTAIKELAARVDLSNPTILKIELFANPLFVLILDTFNSYQLAQETKQAWIAKHGKVVDPWIRTVGSLQESLLPVGSSN